MTAENQRNIDDDEIAKFSRIADKWWDKKTASLNHVLRKDLVWGPL